ncbi:MAG: hypothetical protein KF902_03780 [Phycisphaeraceae bacterium]|nr:hypothetical protein [Phycisphaeraceae bacterium]
MALSGEPLPSRSSASSAFNSSSDSPPSSDSSLIPAHLHSPILSALCHPGSSLCSVARDFRIAVDILAMWLTEPDTREKMLVIEKGGCAHTRMAASVTLASTVGVLQTIIDDYTEARAHARQLRAQHEHLASAASRHDPLPPSHLNQSADRAFLPGEAILAGTSLQAQRIELRRAEGARRACHHLYRLSRIVPIDDSKLARATGCLSATANDSNTSLSNRTATVNERISSSDSSLSSPTLHASGGAGALRDLPLALSLKDDADLSRVACLHEVQACDEERTSSPSPDDTHGRAVGGAATPLDRLTPGSCSPPSSASAPQPTRGPPR